MNRKQYKPHAVSVLRRHHDEESIEDEAPAMATPAVTVETVHVLPPVIILRPSWLDLPASRLISRLSLLGVCSIPAAIIITAAIRVVWRIIT